MNVPHGYCQNMWDEKRRIGPQTAMTHGAIQIVDIDAPDWWAFCRDLEEVARNVPVVDEIKWHSSGETLTSGVTWDYDEDGDEYMLVGFTTSVKNVYAEIDSGTYGNLQALRVYTGRNAEDE